jgi:hypothetical protein
MKNPEVQTQPPFNPESVKFCPLLPSLRSIRVHHAAAKLLAPLHALARWTRLPAGTAVTLEPLGMPRVLHLAVKGWGCGWLPAVLATPLAYMGFSFAVVAVDDSDVEHYLTSVAPMSPSRCQGCSHVVWLGEQVTPEGFSRLLSCTQQPPLRLEVRTAAQSAQAQPFVLQWAASLALTAVLTRALAGVAAPRLVSLVVGDCQQLTNRDVAVLAGACHALQEVTLQNAPLLGDPALHSLAAGCRQLERVQLTHSAVTDQGVVVALTMLGGLQRLELGGASVVPLRSVKALVQQELGAAGRLQWVVEGPNAAAAGAPCGAGACVTWGRDLGRR